jgi:hypothetical protein
MAVKESYAKRIISRLDLKRKVFFGKYYYSPLNKPRQIIWTYNQEIADNKLKKYFGVAHVDRDWTGKFYFYWIVRR